MNFLVAEESVRFGRVGHNAILSNEANGGEDMIISCVKNLKQTMISRSA